jgi:hypothetical protein
MERRASPPVRRNACGAGRERPALPNVALHKSLSLDRFRRDPLRHKRFDHVASLNVAVVRD